MGGRSARPWRALARGSGRAVSRPPRRPGPARRGRGLGGDCTRAVAALTAAGRVALVTGAAHGIGRSICTTLADAGARIWAVDLLPDPLAGTVEAVTALGGDCQSSVADLTDAAAVNAIVATVAATMGRIDILV